MIELRDSLKCFLVLTVIIKHYKTILVVETVVQFKESAANSFNSMLSFLRVKKPYYVRECETGFSAVWPLPIACAFFHSLFWYDLL